MTETFFRFESEFDTQAKNYLRACRHLMDRSATIETFVAIAVICDDVIRGCSKPCFVTRTAIARCFRVGLFDQVSGSLPWDSGRRQGLPWRDLESVPRFEVRMQVVAVTRHFGWNEFDSRLFRFDFDQHMPGRRFHHAGFISVLLGGA